LEVGVGDGNRSVENIGLLLSVADGAPVRYLGVDYFEKITEEINRKELNKKSVISSFEFEKKLEELAKQYPNFSWRLLVGDSKTTLKDVDGEYDLAIIDGGHSVQTIKSDFDYCKEKAKVVLLDDYYRSGVDVTKFGCNTVVDKENATALPVVDVLGNVRISMAIYPSTSFKMTRFLPMFEFVRHVPKEEGKEWKCCTNTHDSLRLFYIELACGGLGSTVKFVTDPENHSDIDVAFMFFTGLSEKVKMEYLNSLKDKVRYFFIEDELYPRPDNDTLRTLHPYFGHSVILDSSPLPSGKGEDVYVNGEKKEVAMYFSPLSMWPVGTVQLQVQTKTCVPNEQVAENLRVNIPRIKNWIAPCKKHDMVAVMCSGGPSLIRDHLGDIRTHVEQGHYVFCVKHAHDKLLAEGVVPYGCILLDPRGHVKDFISDPHPDVIYFVASMVHSSTVDVLLEKGAKVIGWHANISTAEKIVPEFHKVPILISGGSASCTRGISLAQCLGFQKFHLYAYDQYFDTNPDPEKRTENGLRKYVKVKEFGREYWTTLEYMAQTNEMKEMKRLIEMAKFSSFDLDMQVHGDGMVAHVWRNIPPRVGFTFDEVENGVIASLISERTPEVIPPVVTLANF
jgi:hypothetical protein